MTTRVGWSAAVLALSALAVTGAADAQVTTTPVPAVTTPITAPPTPAGPLDVRQQVRRAGRAMTWRLTYRVPAEGTGPLSFRWVAFGGSRDQRTLRRLGTGTAAPAARNGVVTFTRRVAVPVAGAMSGGFCVQFDGAGETCPSGGTARRDELPARVPEVTVISDSVGTGLDYVDGGRAAATGAWSALFDLKVCRRLVAPPCPPNPPSALSVIRSMPQSVGDIALVHVGYNDWAGVYDIGRVMAALKARGVRRVVWLNLQSGAPSASSVNGVVARAAGRYRWFQLADWRSYSAGQSWFVGDGDHVTPSGAYALARFYRAEIARAIRVLEARP